MCTTPIYFIFEQVYRCFMVWGRNFRVVIVPIFMVVATTVLGYLCAYSDDDLNANECIDYRAVFLLSIVTNFVLMALTAGRIWWIRRDACVLLESASVRRYNTVIAMILESGAIYCVTAIIYVISVSLWGPYATSSNIIRGALPQIMNIAPTLIIVRVGLGHSVEDTGSDRPVLPRVGAGNRDAPHPFVGRSRSPSFVIDIRAGCDADTPDDISLEVRGKEI
ncbi:hypothetical protein FB451DRAFT_464592 [Mycena latifolia]|nr:hypothetical protein FB451DRAFT_464592 [Mycena latifolia]